MLSDLNDLLPYLPIHLNEIDPWRGVEVVDLLTRDVEDFTGFVVGEIDNAADNGCMDVLPWNCFVVIFIDPRFCIKPD